MTVPITILTGFLGSGKTTLLNHALRDETLSRALVVVNELGEVPLDHLLVREVREDVLMLDSGCVCCSIRGDLVETLLEQSVERAFDRVFVETTGLADPTPIVATLVRHPELAQHYHLDAIVTAIDGQSAPLTLQQHDEARKQVLLADDLVLTKGDTASEGEVAAARAAARQLNGQARMFEASEGTLDWRPILESTPSTVASRLEVSASLPPAGASQHGSEVRSFAVRSDKAVDFRAFAVFMSMATQFNGERLLRIKGLLRVEDEPGPVVVQSVQHVVYPVYSLPRWPSDDHASRVMVITRGMPEKLFEALHESLSELVGGTAQRADAPADD